MWQRKKNQNETALKASIVKLKHSLSSPNNKYQRQFLQNIIKESSHVVCTSESSKYFGLKIRKIVKNQAMNYRSGGSDF